MTATALFLESGGTPVATLVTSEGPAVTTQSHASTSEGPAVHERATQATSEGPAVATVSPRRPRLWGRLSRRGAHASSVCEAGHSTASPAVPSLPRPPLGRSDANNYAKRHQRPHQHARQTATDTPVPFVPPTVGVVTLGSSSPTPRQTPQTMDLLTIKSCLTMARRSP